MIYRRSIQVDRKLLPLIAYVQSSHVHFVSSSVDNAVEMYDVPDLQGSYDFFRKWRLDPHQNPSVEYVTLPSRNILADAFLAAQHWRLTATGKLAV